MNLEVSQDSGGVNVPDWLHPMPGVSGLVYEGRQKKVLKHL